MKVLPRRRGAVLVNSALAAALLAGAALAYTTLDSGTSSAASKTRIRTAAVSKGTVLATVSGSGTLSSPSDSAQDFATGGKLTSVKVAVGDTVKKGEVLATVDTTTAQQQVDAAQAALNAAQASLTKAQAGVTTTTTEPVTSSATTTPSPGPSPSGGGRGGGGGGGSSAPAPQTTTITTTKVDDSQVAQAQQQVQTAQTNLTNAQTALSGTTLTATADGTVASIAGKVGDTVSGGSSSSSTGSSSGSKASGSGTGSSSSTATPSGFIVLTNPSGMQVSASFSELDSLKLKKGEAATVTLNAQSDTKLNATVLSVSSLPVSSSGSSTAVQYGATLQISGDTSTLRTGLSATISVVTGEADNALSVPTAALQGTGTSRTATLVHDDGSTERVTVTVGVEGDSTVQVVDGLAEGDKVELTSTTAGTGNGFPSGSFPGLGGGGLNGGFGGGSGGGGRSGGGGNGGGGKG